MVYEFGALTVRLIVVVLLWLPDVPLIVTMEAPGVAELDAVNVSVPFPRAPAPLKDAVTPWGMPDTARVTAPWKPFRGVMAMALVLEPPCATLRLEGVAERVNAGGPVIVTVIPAVLIRLPEVPVIVTVAVAAAAELLAISVSVLLVVALTGLNKAVT